MIHFNSINNSEVKMYILNAFASIPDLNNNTKGVTATFGEISTRSLTFSKDVRTYSNNAAYPNVEIITFSSYANDGSPTDPNTNVTTTALAVATWLYEQHNNAQLPVNSAKASLEAAINDAFAAITINGKAVIVRNTRVGVMISSAESGKRLCDYVQFDVTIANVETRVKLWFSDAKFQTQYQQFEIVVIPPVPVIDTLNGTTANVANDLSAMSKSNVINQVSAITSKYKQTDVQPYQLKWHNPTSPTSTLMTEWTVVIYGQAGSDTDAIKDAIRLYIAQHSNLTNWNVIFPDLYSESEFVIVPFWDQLSTPTGGLDDGLYSTAILMSEIQRLVDKYTPAAYGSSTNLPAFKIANVSVCASSYREMMFFALGSPNNKDNQWQLKQRFPDYMAVNTDNPDFARLTQTTQRFVIKLNEAMNKARLFTPNDPIPVGYTRAVKGNREYLGFDYDGFTYHILTRFGFNHD